MTITRIATAPMPWGTLVRGDAERCWPHRKGSRKGDMLGVLKRPLGAANACAAGDEVTIQTHGHILALDGPVLLEQGRIRR